MTPRWVVYDEPAGGGGGGPWDPSQLNALVGWYKADSITGANDGDPVSSLSDSSGTGNNLIPADINNKPAVRTNALNSLNIVEWRGSAATLINTSSTVFQNVSGISRAIVYRQPDTQAINADSVSETNLSDQRFFHQLTLSNQIRQRTKRRHTDAFNPSAGVFYGSASSNTWYIQVDLADFSVPSASGSFNGVAGGSQTVTSGNTTTNATTVSLGGLQSGVAFDVDIAESIYTNSAITTADRERLEGYLAHKWGLTANLPVSHPYKNAAP